MTELKIEKATAKEIFSTSSESLKRILIDTFGVETFKKVLWESITSYEIAIDALPVDDEDIIYPTDAQYIVALKQLCHITKVINGDWVADIENTNQRKWFQVFERSGSGFAFSHSSYYYDGRAADVGSRLCCETKEKSDFIGITFLPKFKLFITNKN